jgi:hypothetical protein
MKNINYITTSLVAVNVVLLSTFSFAQVFATEGPGDSGTPTITISKSPEPSKTATISPSIKPTEHVENHNPTTIRISATPGDDQLENEFHTPTIKPSNAVDELKTKIGSEESRRIEILNKIIVKINSLTGLSAEQKAKIIAQLQKEIDKATAQLSAIKNHNIDSLKTDIKKVKETHTSFKNTLPKATALVALERLNASVTKLTEVEQKLQVKVTAAETAGKNVESLKTALNTINLKIQDLKTKIQTATTLINSISDNSTTDNTAKITAIKAALVAGFKDITEARAQVKIIVEALAEEE